jgi:diguanylate cyclase
MGIVDDIEGHSRTVEAVSRELVALSAANEGDRTESEVIRLVTDIVRANGRLQTQLVDATQTIDEQARDIQCHLQEALTDALTEIPNRRAFEQELRRRFAEKKRHGHAFSLLMLDVDHFKQFNDRHGHQTGDQVLRGVASVLTETLREMDVPARYGGEEFAVILPRTGLADAKQLAERVRSAVDTARQDNRAGNGQVTVSVGLAEATPDDDPASLVKRSDTALYAAKEHGRNCGYFHDGKHCRPIVGSDGKINAQRDTGKQGRETPSAPATRETKASRNGHNERFGVDLRTDALTGLLNRSSFVDSLHRRIAEARRHEEPLSLLVVEVDRLKSIAERHGIRTSQLVELAVPRFLSAVVRETDLIARLGKGEFAILMTQCDVRGAVTTGERIRKAIGDYDRFWPGNNDLHVTISAGIAQAEADDGTFSLIRRAEAALMAAANAGGNQTYVYEGKSRRSTAAVASQYTSRE